MIGAHRLGYGLAVASFGAAMMLSPWAAAQPVPVTLSPVERDDSRLRVTTRDGTQIFYSGAALEELPTYRLATTTPWRDKTTIFEGPLLTDLLRAHDLDDLDAIVVTAQNDYEVRVERSAWQAAPIMVATRLNGQAYSLRELGPFQFVVDADSVKDKAAIGERHLVWMVKCIAPAPD